MPMTIEWDWAEMTGFGMYNDPSGAAVLAGGGGLYDSVYNDINATNNSGGYAGGEIGHMPSEETAT